METPKHLPQRALMASEIQWRRGDSNPKRPLSESIQNSDNSATNRCVEPLQGDSAKQSETLGEQPNDTSEHEIGAHLVHEISEEDPELAKIIAVWAQLPEHIKAAILTLAQTHRATGT